MSTELISKLRQQFETTDPDIQALIRCLIRYHDYITLQPIGSLPDKVMQDWETLDELLSECGVSYRIDEEGYLFWTEEDGDTEDLEDEIDRYESNQENTEQ